MHAIPPRPRPPPPAHAHAHAHAHTPHLDARPLSLHLPRPPAHAGLVPAGVNLNPRPAQVRAHRGTRAGAVLADAWQAGRGHRERGGGKGARGGGRGRAGGAAGKRGLGCSGSGWVTERQGLRSPLSFTLTLTPQPTRPSARAPSALPPTHLRRRRLRRPAPPGARGRPQGTCAPAEGHSAHSAHSVRHTAGYCRYYMYNRCTR